MGNDADSNNEITKFALTTVQLAEEYASARMDFAKAKLTLNGFLADAYVQNKKDSKTGVKEGLAIDKAYLQLIVDDELAKGAYNKMIEEEQNYKGLERVLEARKGYLYLRNDLRKNDAMLKGH